MPRTFHVIEVTHKRLVMVGQRRTLGEACELAFTMAEPPSLGAVVAYLNPWELQATVVARGRDARDVEAHAERMRHVQLELVAGDRAYGRRNTRRRKDTPDG